MTITDLILPKRGIIVPELPSYIKLDMAFALGEGTKLGDKSRYRSHGTISGADWATGAHGKCLDFDKSVPDYVEIPASHTQLDFTSEDFSMIVRANYDAIAAIGWLFSRGLSSADGWYFYVRETGEIRLTTNQAGAQQLTYSATGEVAIGNRYTLGFSRASAVVKLYKNGVDVTSISGEHIDPATCARDAYIGLYTAADPYPFDGKMEFLRIFGGIALSASEHLAYHNALA